MLHGEVQSGEVPHGDPDDVHLPDGVSVQHGDGVVNGELLGVRIGIGEVVGDPAGVGQRHRHLCHMRRTGRPNTGRPTNPTKAGAPGPHGPAAAPTGQPRSSPDVQRQRPARNTPSV